MALYEQNESNYKIRVKELDEMANSTFIKRMPIGLKWKTLKTMAVLERPTPEEEREVALSYIKKGINEYMILHKEIHN